MYKHVYMYTCDIRDTIVVTVAPFTRVTIASGVNILYSIEFFSIEYILYMYTSDTY